VGVLRFAKPGQESSVPRDVEAIERGPDRTQVVLQPASGLVIARNLVQQPRYVLRQTGNYPVDKAAQV